MSTRPEGGFGGSSRLAAAIAAALLLALLAASGSAYGRSGHQIRACHHGSDGQELHWIRPSATHCVKKGKIVVWPADVDKQSRGKTAVTGSLRLSGGLHVTSSSTATTPKDNDKGGGGNWLATWATYARNAFLLVSLGALALVVLTAALATLVRPLLSRHLRMRTRAPCVPPEHVDPSASPSARAGRTDEALLPWWLVWKIVRCPALQIEPFDGGALSPDTGAALTAVVKARLTGGREGSLHLYTIGGEQNPTAALGALQASPQTQPLAATLTLMRLIRPRPRLIVKGALLPATGDYPASGGSASAGSTPATPVALALSLNVESERVDATDFWPSEPPTEYLSQRAAERVLAVAAAGWIQHRAVDYTPGPYAEEVFGVRDGRSWALFRAGAELQRMSLVEQAADAYEQALAADRHNVGALVDLAHLRRREGLLEGAKKLVGLALASIAARDAAYGQPVVFDPDWYRAQIVLATVLSVWAAALDGKVPRGGRWTVPPGDSAALRERARAIAIEVSRAAVKARQALEATCRRITARRGAQWDVTDPNNRRCSRELDEIWKTVASVARQAGRCEPPFGPRFNETPLTQEARRRHARSALEMLQPLARTFEPGALLIVARTSKPVTDVTKTSFERLREFDDLDDDGKREWRNDQRTSVLKALKADDADPERLVDYVESTIQKAPRVDYNLACFYSVASVDPRNAARREELLSDAYEYFRRSIHRTAVLERRGLLDHAGRDPDLDPMRQRYPGKIHELRKISPWP